MNNIWKDRNYSKDFYKDYKNDYCFEYIAINKLDSNFLLYSINKHIIEDNMYDIILESIEVHDCSDEDKNFQAICITQDNETLQSTSFIINFNVDCGWNVYDVKLIKRDYAGEYDKFIFGSQVNYILDIFKEHVEEMLQIKQRYCYNIIREYKNVLNFHYR